ncbi:hypothetical protein BD413DRAFT_488037, partial [Trametes elegans]
MTPGSDTPSTFTVSGDKNHPQTSPQRFSAVHNYHPNKQSHLLKAISKLDRGLQEKNMGRTILAEFSQFMSDVLSKLAADVPPLSDEVVSTVKKEFSKLFRKKRGQAEVKIKEDDLAELMVQLINEHHLCGDYEAALSRFGYDATDESKGKVDAMLYPKGHAPTDGRPDWTHGRMFIEFKRGGTSYDPFDDHSGKPLEADAQKRTGVRRQLFAYGYNHMLYQHRTGIYGLLINGPEFRGMRYDRSGLIVTKNVNYLKRPRDLLNYFATFGQLDAKGQGLDPTATLLTPDSAAFQLMDEYAKDPGTDMEYMERTIIPPYTSPEDTHSSSMLTTASSTPGAASSLFVSSGAGNMSAPARMTRQRAKELAAAQEDAARPPPEHDADLDIEIPDDDEDPRVFKYVREWFRESLEDGWPRYKIEVGPEKRKFLVGKPRFYSVSLFGRGTRAYIALDARSRRFVFLKDSWRPYYKDVATEGHYLKELNSGRAAPYVPRLLCHGDVEDDIAFASWYYAKLHPPRVDLVAFQGETASPSRHPSSAQQPTARPPSTGDKRSIDDVRESDRQTASPEDDETPAFRDYKHYRIVSKDVCLEFISFVTSEQLVRFTYHCVVGHGYAYEDHKLLHRDVSSGNVLILPRLVDAHSTQGGPGMKVVVWNGILADWELAKVVPNGNSNEKARQPERTGTWQFMSVYYVRHQAKLPVTVADDLESFFHVFLFYALRRLHHSIQPENVSTFISLYFDSYEPGPNKTRLCNKFKRDAITSGQLTYNECDITFFTRDEIPHDRVNILIEHLLKYFISRYKVLDWKERGNRKL